MAGVKQDKLRSGFFIARLASIPKEGAFCLPPKPKAALPKDAQHLDTGWCKTAHHRFLSVFHPHPRRQKGSAMSSQQKPYGFRFEESGTSRRIYARFYDAFDILREAEVSEEVLRELEAINRSDRNTIRSDERHRKYHDSNDKERENCSGMSPSEEDIAINSLLHHIYQRKDTGNKNYFRFYYI